MTANRPHPSANRLSSVASPFVVNYDSEVVPAALYAMFGRWILAGTLTLLAACCLAMFFAWRNRIEAAVVTLGAGGLLLIQLIMTGHETLLLRRVRNATLLRGWDFMAPSRASLHAWAPFPGAARAGARR